MTKVQSDQGPKWMYAVGTTYITYSYTMIMVTVPVADLSHKNLSS